MAQFQVNLRQLEAHMDTVRAEQRLLQDLETLLGQLTCADVSESWLSDRRAFLDAAQYAVTERLRFCRMRASGWRHSIRIR